jgi:hypothetical protein
VWSAFKADTKYFGKGKQEHMINYRVANLKKMLAQLQKEGVWVDPKIETSEYGKFGWIKDGEGNRIELWEPPKPRKQRRYRPVSQELQTRMHFGSSGPDRVRFDCDSLVTMDSLGVQYSGVLDCIHS